MFFGFLGSSFISTPCFCPIKDLCFLLCYCRSLGTEASAAFISGFSQLQLSSPSSSVTVALRVKTGKKVRERRRYILLPASYIVQLSHLSHACKLFPFLLHHPHISWSSTVAALFKFLHSPQFMIRTFLYIASLLLNYTRL